jgi:hypothetical protein
VNVTGSMNFMNMMNISQDGRGRDMAVARQCQTMRHGNCQSRQSPARSGENQISIRYECYVASRTSGAAEA